MSYKVSWFLHLQGLGEMVRDSSLSDLVTVIGTSDIVFVKLIVNIMKSFSVRLLRRKPVKGTLTYDIAVLDSTKRHHGYRYATLGFYVRSDVARLFGINLYSLSK